MRKIFSPSQIAAFAAVLTILATAAGQAAPLAIRDTPLFITDNYAPLNMLVMGRDHKLYYEAYNDHSDLNDDDVLDVGYKPSIDYYGYFHSYRCYSYDSATSRFYASAKTTSKKCSGGTWSGDWLNWATMARIDALRKVLYGGLRSTDEATGLTVLERAYIPQDAHGWVKEYISPTVNGYNIAEYTPYSAPASGKSHLFGNTTLLGTSEPLLRVLLDRQDGASEPLRAWNWASIERPVVGDSVVTGTSATGSEQRLGVTMDASFSVRVKVCDTAFGVAELESNCRAYTSGATTVYKPIGVLQDFGENDAMKFGLITGSYSKNTDGGVLRSAIGSIKDEVDVTNGTFKSGTTGIITTLNRLRATGFGGSYQYNCGWITTRAINPGECQMWGNPVAEMMYETLRYFAGKNAATSAYKIAFGDGEESSLPGNGLPVVEWDANTNPYIKNPSCAKPFETVISDINTSYDTDTLPGSAWNSFSGDVTGLDVSSLGQSIWNSEFGAGSKKIFIGEVGGTVDSAPTVKTASSFGNIRGLAPEEPTKEGGYYSGSVAYFGHNNDLNTAVGDQKLTTFAVALASPLPHIEIPVSGKKITLVPFAKSVNGASIDRNGTFQPTDQIVDFYVDTLTSTYGKFRVNFEDVEQGADHDMDAIAIYEYTVSGGSVDIKLTSEYAAGGITQHMGYVISGTTKDGIYLEVVDQRGGDTAVDYDYRLDTPPGQGPGEGAMDGRALPYPKDAAHLMEPLQPITTTRTFSPGASEGAVLLKDPLWYAAKWGGFKDLNKNGLPDSTEWDSDNNGDPDNYFLVTNALKLKDQLSSAFADIISRSGSAASAAVNSGSITDESRLYQALFSTADWSGSFVAFKINPNGTLGGSPWAGDAAKLIPAPASRKIFTFNPDDSKAVPFLWTDVGVTRQAQLQPSDTRGSDRLDYLRGERSKEVRKGGTFRNRNPDSVLGDIVNSAPAFVGAPPFRYGTLESVDYGTYKTDKENRTKMIYVGANDGMLHAINAETGVEQWAFIPQSVFKNLHQLTDPGYQHRFYVDGSPVMGDAFWDGAWHTVLVGGLNNGGQGIYALDISDPTGGSETTIASTKYMWEFTDASSDGADLGQTYSRPVIARVKGGKWVVIFGNGYNNTNPDGIESSSGVAALYVLDLKTGALIRKISTGVGRAVDPLNDNRPNGLSTPAVVDAEGDFVAEWVYAGDLFGNLWKFDITSGDPNEWGVAYTADSKPAPLFTAKDSSNRPQPITSKPSVMTGPRGIGQMVLFGTGKFLELKDRDVATLTPQTFYGIRDMTTGTSTDIISDRSRLVQQTIQVEGRLPLAAPKDLPFRVTSKNAQTSNSVGWYIDLISPGPTFKGEMVVSNPVLRNKRIIFSTLIPNTDPCEYGGSSWLMDMDAYTGSRTEYSPFDLDNDGSRTDQDMVEVTIDGVKVTVPVSGLGSSVGITGQAAIVTNAEGTLEYQYQTGTGSATDTNISGTTKFPPPGALGRQSWRQLR